MSASSFAVDFKHSFEFENEKNEKCVFSSSLLFLMRAKILPIMRSYPVYGICTMCNVSLHAVYQFNISSLRISGLQGKREAKMHSVHTGGDNGRKC